MFFLSRRILFSWFIILVFRSSFLTLHVDRKSNFSNIWAFFVSTCSTMSTLSFLLLFAAVCAVFFSRKKKNNLPYPPGPPQLPLIGNAHQFPKEEELIKTFEKWQKEYGEFCQIYNWLALFIRRQRIRKYVSPIGTGQVICSSQLFEACYRIIG